MASDSMSMARRAASRCGLACILDGTIIAFLKNLGRRDDKSEGVENVTCSYDGFAASGLLPDLSPVHAIGRGSLPALQPVPASPAGDVPPRATASETHYIARPALESQVSIIWRAH